LLAQTKQTTTINQAWGSFYPQFRLSEHWGIWNDDELQQKQDFLTGHRSLFFAWPPTII